MDAILFTRLKPHWSIWCLLHSTQALLCRLQTGILDFGLSAGWIDYQFVLAFQVILQHIGTRQSGIFRAAAVFSVGGLRYRCPRPYWLEVKRLWLRGPGCEIRETPNSAGCDKHTLRCFLMLFSSNQMLFKPLYAFVFTDHDDDIIHRKNMSGIDVSHRLFAALNGYDV